ncbi:hypothetical protein GCM10009066_09970 [Halarchaeum salinum]|uniref:Uncharacterized protein n=1 Tax=Halarchaeum salinum TaxID=489912 RepID=A0AAV3S6V7_9EURY
MHTLIGLVEIDRSLLNRLTQIRFQQETIPRKLEFITPVVVASFCTFPFNRDQIVVEFEDVYLSLETDFFVFKVELVDPPASLRLRVVERCSLSAFVVGSLCVEEVEIPVATGAVTILVIRL